MEQYSNGLGKIISLYHTLQFQFHTIQHHGLFSENIVFYSFDESVLQNKNKFLQFKIIFLQTTKMLNMGSVNSDLPRRKLS